MSEAREFRLPDVGEGLTEADIVKWHVKPGDAVELHQTLVEIETAKSIVELPSPYTGTVTELLVPEGATADVGTPIIVIETGASDGAAAPAASAGPAAAAPAAAAPAAAAPAEQQPAAGPAILVGYGVKLGRTTRRPRKAVATIAPAANGSAAAVLAKPPVRKLAKDLGIDLAGLTGTGPHGSITRDDVQGAAAGAGREPVPEKSGVVPVTGPREERVPVRGVRKHMAAAMTTSAFTAPHVTEFLQIDITQTMSAVERLRSLPEFAQARLSPLLLVARALIVAAARHPVINSSWDEAAQEIVVRHYVNLGIAVATDRGLVVPNVKEAQALKLPELAAALTRLAQTARAGQASPADLAGGTISITNVGVFGVDSGTPILPPGETAILALGQVRDAPWVVDGELAVRKVCTLALSFDHRVVDGELGSAVLRDVGAMLTDPLTMLAWT